MAYFDLKYESASPVLTLPPQPAHCTPAMGMPTFASQYADHSFQHQNSTQQHHHFTASAGRKRSRDEAAPNLEPEPAPALPTPESEDDWEFGEGMVLIKRKTGYVADASSQSGTWLEEKREDALEALARHRESQLVDSRQSKSQRIDPFSGASSLQHESQPSTNMASTTPVIDDFTLHLGIGWRKIGDSQHLQAAARGWARFIENHYPLTGVSIRLESNGLQSYLVESNEGFFLFAENLRHGRLVSTSVQGALQNLQCCPPAFDGAEQLLASASTPSDLHQFPPVVDSGGMEIDMDA